MGIYRLLDNTTCKRNIVITIGEARWRRSWWIRSLRWWTFVRNKYIINLTWLWNEYNNIIHQTCWAHSTTLSRSVSDRRSACPRRLHIPICIPSEHSDLTLWGMHRLRKPFGLISWCRNASWTVRRQCCTKPRPERVSALNEWGLMWKRVVFAWVMTAFSCGWMLIQRWHWAST